MSDIERPAVDVTISRNISFERKVGEEVFGLLEAYGEEEPFVIDNYTLNISQTDAVDLVAEDKSSLQFRISSLPVFVIEVDNVPADVPQRTATSFYAVDIEQRLLPGEENPDEEDERYAWQPHVRVIIDTVMSEEKPEPDVPIVLDGETHKPLDQFAINRLDYILGLMRDEFRGMLFEDYLFEAAKQQALSLQQVTFGVRKNSDPVMFTKFDPGEFMNGCDDCGAEGGLCQHDKSGRQ